MALNLIKHNGIRLHTKYYYTLQIGFDTELHIPIRIMKLPPLALQLWNIAYNNYVCYFHTFDFVASYTLQEHTHIHTLTVSDIRMYFLQKDIHLIS